jgi:methylenetetrahydrofolate reductase (NADPH)
LPTKFIYSAAQQKGHDGTRGERALDALVASSLSEFKQLQERNAMRVTDLWKNNERTTLSFEFFPPRGEKEIEKMEKVIDDLANLKPDLLSVTFGAGGSSREGSYQLVDKLRNDKRIETIAYFAGYGLGPDDITSVLDNYKNLGVETLLVLRGDPPRGDKNFKPHPESLPHASDLLTFIGSRYDFCMGAAGYPEGHIDAESKEKDLEYLKIKVKNGAQFIIAQFFYDNRYFFDFVERCRAIGINVPILPGVMPIYNVKMTEMLANLCGVTITDEVRQGLAKLPPDDKKAVENFGIDFATQQCRELIKWGVPGVHIYTMDRSQTTMEIVNRLRKEGLLVKQ